MTVTDLYEEHRGFLWRLVYRLTGNAADAEDIVQETFVRAIDRPPADASRPWRPWLVQVALNLGRDALRKRRRRPYTGMWLPTPIEAEPPSHEPVDESGNPASRYDQVESLSFAFLLALEALTPLQRAVLLLRDVFDYSVRETAEALSVSEANIKTSHLRARRAMAAYDASRVPHEVERNRGVFERFLEYLTTGDVEGVESMLAADVITLSDSAGEFRAASVPVKSRANVAKLFLSLAKKFPPSQMEARLINGVWSYMVGRPPLPGLAPLSMMQTELDAEGRIRRIYLVLASQKLAAVRPLQ
ncbi:MAG: sigma-70 family RNA polymerase sigma factor [Bryobacteraceae bacterium]